MVTWLVARGYMLSQVASKCVSDKVQVKKLSASQFVSDGSAESFENSYLGPFSICNDGNSKAICKVCHKRIPSSSLLLHGIGYQVYRLKNAVSVQPYISLGCSLKISGSGLEAYFCIGTALLLIVRVGLLQRFWGCLSFILWRNWHTHKYGLWKQPL